MNKIDELSKNIDCGDLKFTVTSTGVTNFCELKDPVPFRDSIKKRETSIEEARFKQIEFDRC